ncbi:MAG TPA: PQQ-binding-like beta-propeller repeat protein, partial [Gammaproteobacteria bacterium]|nr:PQQ-binding-like beta-propeller repeat protein [Gammaproteobacteria bacterium]
MSPRLAAALALLTLAVAAGCAHKNRGEPPAELTSIEQTLDVRKLWSAKVGGKSERLRLGLRPATDGARIFAGSHDGDVLSFDAQTGRKVWSVKTKLPLAAGPGYGDGLL